MNLLAQTSDVAVQVHPMADKILSEYVLQQWTIAGGFAAVCVFLVLVGFVCLCLSIAARSHNKADASFLYTIGLGLSVIIFIATLAGGVHNAAKALAPTANNMHLYRAEGFNTPDSHGRPTYTHHTCGRRW